MPSFNPLSWLPPASRTYAKFGLIMILFVVFASALSNMVCPRPLASAANPRRFERIITDAITFDKQAQRDTNAVDALMASTRALAYVEAARALARDSELEKISGLHPDELVFQFQQNQRAAADALR